MTDNKTITVFGETLKREASQYFQSYWCNEDESLTALSEMQGQSKFYSAYVYVKVNKQLTVTGTGNTIPEAEADCRNKLEELSMKAKKLAKKGLK